MTRKMLSPAAQELKFRLARERALKGLPDTNSRGDAVRTSFEPSKLTPWQKDFLEKYGDGVGALLPEIEDAKAFGFQLDTIGDSFVRAGLTELDPREDCNTYDEAVRRLRSIADDFLAVAQAIEDTLA